MVLPGFGELVAAGMTLEQFEQNVQEIVARQSFQDVQVVAMVRSLETIQVTIVGQAYRPGTYAMGAAATLFNALYFAGGPSEEGSFRRITLKRGEERYTIDFYRYLLEGDGSADRTLQDGDLIYIEPRGATVTLSGEVTRPGIYELLPGEGLADLIRMAGGLRSTGFAKSVQIESVREGSEPVLLNVDATADLSEAPPASGRGSGDRLPDRLGADEHRSGDGLGQTAARL
ncbi:MAG: hypothetical protein KatS3mg115_2007 [Candidatus Poribacteria bacterium]|nr:MAG: hypothetical protein KatS3mg115_2007 [Candidatus Poribacteria bacterium]